jgi:hypothetical protein
MQLKAFNMNKLSQHYAIIFITLLFLSFSSGCEEQTYCKEYFSFISVRVTGVDLQDAYTIRFSTGDTLRFDQNNYQSGQQESYYTVIDDSFLSVLNERKENFIFIGKVADTIAIKETYYIGTDGCHVIKIHGKDEVNL